VHNFQSLQILQFSLEVAQPLLSLFQLLQMHNMLGSLPCTLQEASNQQQATLHHSSCRGI